MSYLTQLSSLFLYNFKILFSVLFVVYGFIDILIHCFGLRQVPTTSNVYIDYIIPKKLCVTINTYLF